MRTSIACVWTLVAVLAAGCGSAGPQDTTARSDGSGRTPSKSAGELAADRADAARDIQIDTANAQLERAAEAKDRSGVAQAQRRLDALAGAERKQHSDEVPEPEPDPFQAVLEDFRFKQGPLYVQQIDTSGGDHRAYVAVIAAQFCLSTPEARLDAARAVYAPLDRRMRAANIKNFEFVVVPTSETEKKLADALAIGRGGQLRLTARGRAC